MLHSLPAAFAQITTPADHFERGNAAYVEGDFAGAIEAYSAIEESGRISPAVMENLAAAYRAVGQEGPAVWAESSARALTHDYWAIAATVGIAALALLVILKVVGAPSISRRVFRGSMTAASLVAAAGIAGLVIGALRFDHAVVLAPTPLLISPFDGAEAAAELEAGSAVTHEETHDGFALVTTADGGHGWVPQSLIRDVRPRG